MADTISSFDGAQLDKVDQPRKKDRTARLMLVERILNQHPSGITVSEIADLCGVSERTAYRDLKALQDVIDIKIWEDGSKRGVVKGQYLTPVRFHLVEALNIFLAARLMLRYTNRFVPNIASTFVKLNSVVPPPLRDQIKNTINWMQKLPVNENYQRTMAKLAEAWISQIRVRILYKSWSSEKPVERTIEPYFIEPAAPGHSSYVIAYCHRAGEVRTFKMERIESIQLTTEKYSIPASFDINRYFGSSFGIVVEGDRKAETVKLRFSPDIARIISEPIWHPSQILEPQNDGSVIMKLKVTNTVDLYRWILNWGDQVEVLEPEELRKEIAQTVRNMLDMYGKK